MKQSSNSLSDYPRLFKVFKNLLFWGWGITVLFHSLMYSLAAACVCAEQRSTGNSGKPGQHSNQLGYPARASKSILSSPLLADFSTSSPTSPLQGLTLAKQVCSMSSLFFLIPFPTPAMSWEPCPSLGLNSSLTFYEKLLHSHPRKHPFPLHFT